MTTVNEVLQGQLDLVKSTMDRVSRLEKAILFLLEHAVLTNDQRNALIEIMNPK